MVFKFRDFLDFYENIKKSKLSVYFYAENLLIHFFTTLNKPIINRLLKLCNNYI